MRPNPCIRHPPIATPIVVGATSVLGSPSRWVEHTFKEFGLAPDTLRRGSTLTVFSRAQPPSTMTSCLNPY
eukprot:CAMPEP_0175911838 /NCGR_PEP_ID=MMETSP0108-20121206/8407_1 /TAXON_ID=195067 ORGANISM="Goniomonas pacifica, Strain CCMP1869" /NCGR_SAMPLE_ID=MMETSP0108 /ASSEMBLY_ACC=CAM_ASM_000204 /LENGTH=70 /DNA_ID=CAMNT_0017234111 /DNA_START=174 /DNA_END=386 /DNA_ORIENTATION=-